MQFYKFRRNLEICAMELRFISFFRVIRAIRGRNPKQLHKKNLANIKKMRTFALQVRKVYAV